MSARHGLRSQATSKGFAAPEPVPGRRGRITSYGDDRVCASLLCQTQLSRYNHSPLCALHDRAQDE